MTEQELRDKFEGNISLGSRAKNSKGKYINSLAQAQWMGFNWGVSSTLQDVDKAEERWWLLCDKYSKHFLNNTICDCEN